MLFDEFLIKSHVQTIRDWPRQGLNFRDITPLLQNPKAFRMVMDTFIQRYMEYDLSHIAALDARGFLLGSTLAYTLHKPLVLIRKSDKLPGSTDSIDYSSAFGESRMEVQSDSFCSNHRVLVVDDLITTGQTLLAAHELIKRQGAEFCEAAVLIDLTNQGGSQRLQELGIPLFCLCTY